MSSQLLQVYRLFRSQRRLLVAMTKRELRYRYAGTGGGVLWSFAQPMATILVYWLVFSVGLKVQPVKDVPFIVVYVAGFLPWMLFSETLSASSGSVTGNPHLVKKIAFPTELLPVIQLMTGLTVHAGMLVLFMVLLAANGIAPSFYNLQFLYYLAGLMVFNMGLSWFVAALNVLHRDAGQVLALLLQMWFWLTPIVWPLEMLPEAGQRLIRLNPMLYVVQGYRNSFVLHRPFWEDLSAGVVYWAVAGCVFCLGWLFFSRVKAEFVDAL